MPRDTGDRYACESCGSELVYTKPCPCPETADHREICCGTQMRPVEPEADED
jgi:hypothetical protein